MCAAIFAVPMLAACDSDDDDTSKGPEIDPVDYVGQLKLDMDSETKKQEVEVRLFIDGDTTHFNPIKDSDVTDYNAEDFIETQGYIKARYLAINTPESTGKIEKWGKTASNFTHDKLADVESIIVESDDENWNIDSTGERYLLWVWYMPKGETEYRNLNIEILQNGFALASSTANNRYGEIATAALAQAQAMQLHVFSPEDTKDENYYEGEAIPVTLKELRCNINDYVQTAVAVEGTVTASFDNSVYIEDYDEESGLYFGMPVYYGFPKDDILTVLIVGNRVRVVGSVTEFQGTYQISGVSCNKYRELETNSTVLGKDKAAFTETSAVDIISGSVDIDFEDETAPNGKRTITLDYGEAIMSTSVTVANLTVSSIYSTKDAKGVATGEMSITCLAEDNTTKIVIRTQKMTDANGNTVDESYFPKNTKLTVKGIVDYYSSSKTSPYQIAVHRFDYFTFV